MTESMNLDSADIVGSLEEFGPLDTSLEAELDMLSHEEQIKVNEMDMIPEVLTKDEMHVVKEEIVENMEQEDITEEQLMEETIAYQDVNMTNHVIESVMDIGEDGTSYHEDEQPTLAVSKDESVIENDNEMFSGHVIGEEIVTDEQVIIDSQPHIYEDCDDKDFQDISDIMGDNIVTEETVIDGSEMMETMKPEVIEEKKFEANKISLPEVYVVNPRSSTLTAKTVLSTNAVIAPKDAKVTRFVMPTTDTGQLQQTIRIVAPQGKFVGGAPKTITISQAKQMGFKLNQLMTATKGSVGKLVMPKKTVTVMKSPAKILPAPPAGSQKYVIRSTGGSLKAGTLLTSSSTGVIRIPIPASQAAQLQMPTSKQLQFVKLVGNNKTGATLVPVQTLSAKSIPVALPTSIINSQQTFKVLPVTTQPTSGQPQTATVAGAQRVLIPATSTQVVSGTVVQPSQQTPRHSIVMLQPQIISQDVHTFEENLKTPDDNDSLSFTQESAMPTVSTVKSTSNGKRAATPNLKVNKEEIVKTEVKSESELDVVEANGIRPRKPCNCTKSMCLKLYCDCFANGEFCHQCNCTTCYNNLSHEEERQRAIKSCLDRNPTAFRPKIGKSFVGSEERRHNKGCNCRRSGCLKNYCECYEAKIPCSKNCKCVGCKNLEGFTKRGIGLGSDDDKYGIREKVDGSLVSRNSFDPLHTPGHRQVLNLMSPQLVEATCQCLIAQVEEWSRNGNTDYDLAHALIIEELGRCLAQIIECINKSLAQIPQCSS